MTEHQVTVIMLSGAEFQAVCTCEYASVVTPDDLVAAAQAEQHLAYAAEVRALTQEPRA